MSEITADASSVVREDGFEYEGTFYRWSVGDTGKDLMLIDKFSGMPVPDFFEMVDDEAQRGRAPILLTMIATSIRAEHPDWSVERITRTVMELKLSDVTIMVGEPEVDELPPASADEESTGATSPSVRRLPSSEAAPATFETSSVTQG